MKPFAVIGATLLVLSVACDDSPAQNAVGISRDGQAWSVHYVACAGESVQRVELLSTTGAVVGDGNDEVLWAITSDSSSLQTAYEVGTTPEGFAESVAFAGAVPETGSLAASVDTSAVSGVVVTFSPAEVSEDEVLTGHGERLSLPEFEERATQDC